MLSRRCKFDDVTLLAANTSKSKIMMGRECIVFTLNAELHDYTYRHNIQHILLVYGTYCAVTVQTHALQIILHRARLWEYGTLVCEYPNACGNITSFKYAIRLP